MKAGDAQEKNMAKMVAKRLAGSLGQDRNFEDLVDAIVERTGLEIRRAEKIAAKEVAKIVGPIIERLWR